MASTTALLCLPPRVSGEELGYLLLEFIPATSLGKENSCVGVLWRGEKQALRLGRYSIRTSPQLFLSYCRDSKGFELIFANGNRALCLFPETFLSNLETSGIGRFKLSPELYSNPNVRAEKNLDFGHVVCSVCLIDNAAAGLF